jgi:hypothetical protein
LVVGSTHNFNVTSKDNDMTRDQKIIRTKVGVLDLAKETQPLFLIPLRR